MGRSDALEALSSAFNCWWWSWACINCFEFQGQPKRHVNLGFRCLIQIKSTNIWDRCFRSEIFKSCISFKNLFLLLMFWVFFFLFLKHLLMLKPFINFSVIKISHSTCDTSLAGKKCNTIQHTCTHKECHIKFNKTQQLGVLSVIIYTSHSIPVSCLGILMTQAQEKLCEWSP